MEPQYSAYNHAKETSQVLLSACKNLSPVVLTEKGVVVMPSDRDAQRATLAAVSRSSPWFVTVNESWVYPPDHRELRREAIMVNLFEGGKITRAEQCLFRRDSNGGIYFEEWLDLGALTLVPMREGIFGAIA